MKKINGLMTSAGLLSLAACTGKVEPAQPDVLFILVDDMQKNAISFCGNPDTYTPNIDRIMKRAVVFDKAYTNGALCGALSMPSRAMIMTGRGVFEVQSDGMKIPECHTTMAEHFRENGYRTFETGKWHSDYASFHRSFTEGENIFFGGMHPYETGGHTAANLHHFDPAGHYDSPFIADCFSSKMFADAAVDFLSTVKQDERPYFAYVAFTSPHDPRNILPDYGHKYTADTLKVPANFLPEHPFDNGELAIRDEMVLPPPRSEAQIKNELAFYYGMVSEVDLQIGRVLKALEDSGRIDNTILVFAADNGLAMGQNGLLGKQSLYDHSVGVPLALIDFRKEQQGSRTDAYCYLADIFPTLCELADLDTPASVTGKSLVPAMAGEDGLREDLFFAYSNQQRALLKDNFKYIIYNVEGKITEQLFDLENDPGELQDLSSEKPEMVKEFRAILARRMAESGDFCTLEQNPWWSDGHKLEWDELIDLYIFDK